MRAMIRTTLLAVSALLLAPLPAAAQSISQAELDARYDRALAAGYKALFLCSAIANAERNGATRTPESVIEWELTGIQAPLDDLVGELPFEIERREDGNLDYVEVNWADDMPPRIAADRFDAGCALAPIGSDSTGPLLFTTHLPALIPWDVADDASRLGIDADPFSTSYGEDARTTALVIAHDSKIVTESYADGFSTDTPQRTWSVAKSLAATILGMAVHGEGLDIHASAGLGLDEDDPRRAITIDHLLRMASGRYSDTPGNRTDPLYFGGANVTERASSWPLLHQPGAVWRYANNDTLGAIHAMEEQVAEDHFAIGAQRVIGMSGAVVEGDWQLNPLLSSQVWATARDLARLGQLHLNDGVLPDGTRILPEGWVQYVSSPSGPQPESSRGWGYGAGWWLLNNSEGIPRDTFMAAGNRGQYIVVIPSRDVVIVRRGEDPAGGSGFDIEAFTRDVLAALEE